MKYHRVPISAGPLLKEILQNMEKTKTDTQLKGAYFYSAHDITIVNTMRSMGFTSKLLKPDYGAMLIFEVHLTNDEKQEVKVNLLISLSFKSVLGIRCIFQTIFRELRLFLFFCLSTRLAIPAYDDHAAQIQSHVRKDFRVARFQIINL